MSTFSARLFEQMDLSDLHPSVNRFTHIINLQNGVARYALYPVWLLNTKWNGEDYIFAMNGQTGKFVGDLPLDKKAYQRNFAILGGIFSIVASVLAFLADYMFF